MGQLTYRIHPNARTLIPKDFSPIGSYSENCMIPR
jgi:hypothetical protein